MHDYAELALLPDGLHDDLPPRAAHEAQVIERLIGCFATWGYERVKPPLVEFEESLLSGPGRQVARHTFRLMDPITQRMMGVRADMTTQVARIAMTRLERQPRPVRLCYAGQVLRVRGTQLRPERQYAQAGLELIGVEAAAADAEVVLLAVEAMRAVGVGDLSVDLTVPSLVPLVCAELGLDEVTAVRVRAALDAKDRGALKGLPRQAERLLAQLLEAAGPAGSALEKLQGVALPAAAQPLHTNLAAVVELLQASGRTFPLTIDPGETHGFEYQTGVSFTLFGRRVRGELGRGGRYRLANDEAATGFTLYMDSVMRAVPAPPASRRLYLPFATPLDEGQALRADGWRTLCGLEAEADAEAEARRLGCTHLLRDGQVVALS